MHSSKFEIAAVWCSFFTRPGVFQTPRALNYAYRSPSLFISKMKDAGYPLEFLICDEELRLSDLDGTQRTLQDETTLLYVMTHGELKPQGYEVFLNRVNWVPGNTGIGQSKLAVAVFDTCELIKKNQNWKGLWRNAKLGSNLRLLLGFDGPAAVDRGSARRGGAFAENLLNGKTFAEAWILAVNATAVRPRYNNAVAIAIGDSLPDAQNVLGSATINSLPGARVGGNPPIFQEKY